MYVYFPCPTQALGNKTSFAYELATFLRRPSNVVSCGTCTSRSNCMIITFQELLGQLAGAVSPKRTLTQELPGACVHPGSGQADH